MSFSPVRLIARREVNDTLTDWRILTPIFILTFILPMLLISAANFAIRFVGDRNAIVLLIPFTMLLVGFIPASFSLITALESFVGERERNSLEALLAMPISDSQLYGGKLISSLLTPLLSSYLAMSVFAIALWARFPDLFYAGLKFEYLVAVLLLVTAKAIVMVAGAIIISSHTTSVRAANLLASFVLIPTASVVQLEAILMISKRWDVLWLVALLLLVFAVALVRTGMAAFNREEILSREHEQLNLRRIRGTFGAFFREYQPPGVSPDQYAGLPFSPRRFYRHELPALLRAYRLPLLVALVAALFGLASGGYIGQNFRIRPLDAYLATVGKPPAAGIVPALVFFASNIRVAFASSVFSLFAFGTFAFLIPAVAFAQIGFVANALAERGGSWLGFGADSPLQFVLAYVLPHGIIELPALIFAAALGIRIGAALLSPPHGFTVGQNILWSLAQFLKAWMLVLVPLFLLSGLIEGFVTPLIVRMLYGGWPGN